MEKELLKLEEKELLKLEDLLEGKERGEIIELSNPIRTSLYMHQTSYLESLNTINTTEVEAISREEFGLESNQRVLGYDQRVVLYITYLGLDASFNNENRGIIKYVYWDKERITHKGVTYASIRKGHTHPIPDMISSTTSGFENIRLEIKDLDDQEIKINIYKTF